ncbi:MAG: hypothetical protein CVU41_17805 [Chloroflexi bacterium HGW-Chloroflexi-3]|nr:MAG: hypothetical protein CVU41_17805 [Chloroflexi bacterium HGW-Chloroflexi-3]
MRRISGVLVGIIRDGPALRKALDAIADLRNNMPLQYLVGHEIRYNLELVDGLQNENLLDILEAFALSSVSREESRGRCTVWTTR